MFCQTISPPKFVSRVHYLTDVSSLSSFRVHFNRSLYFTSRCCACVWEHLETVCEHLRHFFRSWFQFHWPLRGQGDRYRVRAVVRVPLLTALFSSRETWWIRVMAWHFQMPFPQSLLRLACGTRRDRTRNVRRIRWRLLSREFS